MQRLLLSPRTLPLFGIATTRAIEQRATASLDPHTLMRRAGLATARLALAVAPHASSMWVAAGPGNNGGDGLDAAIHLRAAGKTVRVSLFGDPTRLPADAADALTRARSAGVRVDVGAIAPPAEADFALDTVLGIGASRAPEGLVAQALAYLDALACPLLAVDVPSGLHSGTGQLLGKHAVRAAHTLALLTAKPGLFTAQGRDHVGTVWFDDLGVSAGQATPDAWLSGPEFAAMASRRHVQHKGSFGDVAVVGGAKGMSGAALLAARAAHAAGAGRVFVSMLDGGAMDVEIDRPELMFRASWWKGDDATLSGATLVCGCGGGDAVREPLPRLLSTAGRLVLDADALNAIAADASLQSLLRARASRGRPSVLTPHPLEAARLLGCDTDRVQADRLVAAQQIADRFSCVVLLKGSGTVIAAPAQIPHINASGNASLATAGTGDVLAGWLGGLWSAMGDISAAAAFRAACTATYLHGNAADTAASTVIRAADLIERMSAPR